MVFPAGRRQSFFTNLVNPLLVLLFFSMDVAFYRALADQAVCLIAMSSCQLPFLLFKTAAEHDNSHAAC